jgi:uncharacterized protein HemX
MDSMNQTTPPMSTPPVQPTPVATPSHEGGRGALIGTIIIIVLLVVAGGYVWFTREPMASQNPDETILNMPDETLNSLNQQTSSDELNAIEADLNNTDLNNLGSDFGTIEGELNAVQ